MPHVRAVISLIALMCVMSLPRTFRGRSTKCKHDAYRHAMEIAGLFAVTGLLLLAFHLARPEVLRWIVDADTRLWWFMPWVTREMLDPDGTYQRAHRRAVIAALSFLTALSTSLFVLSYVELLP